jgi:hypothetical protein
MPSPSGSEDGRATLSGTRRTTNPAETGHASKNRPAPKGQNRLAQGRARRRSRRAPPWVNGQPRTSVALKGRDTCAPIARNHASRTSKCQRHAERDRFALRVVARESRLSIHIRFAIARDQIPISVLSCPFGAIAADGGVYSPTICGFRADPGRHTSGRLRLGGKRNTVQLSTSLFGSNQFEPPRRTRRSRRKNPTSSLIA